MNECEGEEEREKSEHCKSALVWFETEFELFPWLITRDTSTLLILCMFNMENDMSRVSVDGGRVQTKRNSSCGRPAVRRILTFV